MPKSTLPIYRVALVKESRVATETKVICRPEDAAEVFGELLGDRDREVFAVLALSVKNRILGASLISMGTLDSSLVHPREVFKPALLLNAYAVIVAHNHPSGDATPSHEDRAVTARLVEAGKILGVEVLDHMIVTDAGFASMKLLGFL